MTTEEGLKVLENKWYTKIGKKIFSVFLGTFSYIIEPETFQKSDSSELSRSFTSR